MCGRAGCRPMKSPRILRHAEVQARVRARLARQPDEAAWVYILDASDVDNAIERVRSTGLAFWVAALPRGPDAASIETHLRARLGDFLLQWARLLPADWQAVAAWARAARELLWMPQILNAAAPELPTDADPALRHAATLPMVERVANLKGSHLGRYMDERGADWAAWLEDFERVCPGASGREAYVVARIRAAVDSHLAQLKAARDQVLAGAQEVPEDVQWRLRDRLAADLRPLLAGDPFHAGLTLIYGLLEVIEFERCRAVLLAFAQGWVAPTVLRRML